VGHGGGHFLADRAKLRDQRGRHVQHLSLGSVRIADKAAIEPAGGAGNFGNGLGDTATGTRFGGRQQQAFVLQGLTHLGGQFVDIDTHLGLLLASKSDGFILARH
jgi:hypothetical protein